MGGITIHKPLVPPTVVLALGNGFDFWAIHAAQKWHVCIQLLTHGRSDSDLVATIVEMPSYCT